MVAQEMILNLYEKSKAASIKMNQSNLVCGVTRIDFDLKGGEVLKKKPMEYMKSNLIIVFLHLFIYLSFKMA